MNPPPFDTEPARTEIAVYRNDDRLLAHPLGAYAMTLAKAIFQCEISLIQFPRHNFVLEPQCEPGQRPAALITIEAFDTDKSHEQIRLLLGEALNTLPYPFPHGDILVRANGITMRLLATRL